VPLKSLLASGASFIDDGARGIKYTKSTMQYGQQMHKAYKAADVVAIKEFREISGIRPDFVDF
jgi:hypothetical protein